MKAAINVETVSLCRWLWALPFRSCY